MPFSFHCESCNKKFTVSSKLIGKKIRCKGCQNVMRIPDPADFVAIQTEWVVDCDDCGRQHRPDESLMGKRIRCKCGAILHLQENTDAQIQLAPTEPLAPLDDPFALPVDDHAAPVTAGFVTPAAAVPGPYQAPPPAVSGTGAAQRTAAANRVARRRREDELLSGVEREETWRRRHNPGGADDDEWGIDAGFGAGLLMLLGGIVWAVVAWQAGYIYPFSFVLMLIGVVAMIRGLL